MHWLYLVVAIVFLGVTALKVTPYWLAVILVIGALVLFIAWMLGWMAARVSGSSRDDLQILSPEELRHLREQAEARRAAAAASTPPDEPAG